MGDLRNAVSAAVVGRVVLYDHPVRRLGVVAPHDVINMDASTLVLHDGGAGSMETWFLPGEKKKARKQGRQLQQVGKSKGEYLRLKLWATTSASGMLYTPIFSMVAKGVTEMARIKVIQCDTCFLI
jgi:hypothetical protein